MIFNVIICLTMFICFFSLSSSMLGNLYEQCKEISVMRAIGFSKDKITKLYVYEAFILVIASSINGSTNVVVASGAAISLAVGAPIVIKPAPATPLGSLRLAELFDETDLPKGMLQVLPVGNEVADGMARSLGYCRGQVGKIIGYKHQGTAQALGQLVVEARKRANGRLAGIILDLRGIPGGLLDPGTLPAPGTAAIPVRVTRPGAMRDQRRISPRPVPRLRWPGAPPARAACGSCRDSRPSSSRCSASSSSVDTTCTS